ncbi:hypothetical protein KHDHEBDM_01692 [Pectobacterium polaris]|nr:hypothetical protein KHDHEBDM_01692 [Pectobacterium polaris]
MQQRSMTSSYKTISAPSLSAETGEKMMFALYYGQSKIIIDCDPDDFYYPHYD